MKTLIAFIIEINAVLAIEQLIDYTNLTSHAIKDLRQNIPSQLDEVITEKLNVSHDIHSESKGGALQKILSSVSFICRGRFEGYYTDIEFGCQIFHYCKQNGLRFTFVCPAKSIFNQKEMTCDHNISDPKIFCEESHNYYYLNSILYAQRRDVINNSIIGSNESEDKPQNIVQPSNTLLNTSSSTLQQSIPPTVVLPINTTKLTTVSIRPFWGYNAIQLKKNDSNNKSSTLMSTMSPMIEQTPYPTWFTEMLQKKPFSYQKLKLNENPQNWSAIKNNKYKSHLVKPNQLSSKTVQTFEPINSIIVSTNTPTQTPTHIDWDDVETGEKIHKTQSEAVKPQLNQKYKESFIPDKSLNSLSAVPLSLPTFPIPSIKAEPLVVLRPSHLPGSLPIATLYTQKDYMFGKPRIVHKGLYLNPTFGASILNPRTLLGSVAPLGLMPASSEGVYTKVAPNHNSNLLSNFQNALTKFSFNDIFGLKLSLNQGIPKQRSDFSETFNYKTSLDLPNPLFSKSTLLNPIWPSRLLSKMPSYLSPIYNKIQRSNNLNPTGHEVYFPSKLERIESPNNTSLTIDHSNEDLMNKKYIQLRNPESVTTPLPQSFTRSGYSIRLEDTIKMKNLMQPSIFFAINDNNIRQKWFETYANIKKSYTAKDQINRRKSDNSTTDLILITNFDIKNITQLFKS